MLGLPLQLLMASIDPSETPVTEEQPLGRLMYKVFQKAPKICSGFTYFSTYGLDYNKASHW